MPRVNGIMQALPNVYGTPGRPIESAKYNSQLDDLISDANNARPITAGGTGAVDAADARGKLGVTDELAKKFGLTIAPIANADTLIASGVYLTGDTFTGSPFAGTNGENQGYLEHVTWVSGAYAMQIHTQINGAGLVRVRIKDNGVWRAWRAVMHMDHEIPTRPEGSSDGFVANTNFVTKAVDAAVALLRGGVDEPRNTLKKLMDWALANFTAINANKVTTDGIAQIIAKKVVKGYSQDAIAGNFGNADFEVQAVNSASTVRVAFHIPGVVAGNFGMDSNGRLMWSPSQQGPYTVYHTGNLDVGALASDAELAAAIATVQANKVTTDTEQAVRARKIFQSLIGYSITNDQWVHAPLRVETSLSGSGASIAFVNHTDGLVQHLGIQGGTGALSIGGAPIYTTANLDVAGMNARTNDKFEQLRLVNEFSSGGTLDYRSPSGGVLTGYSRQAGQAGDVIAVYGRYLQGFSPSRGWVQAFNS